MDSPPCNVIYVHRNVGQDRLVPVQPDGASAPSNDATNSWSDEVVREHVQPLLDAFGDVHVSATGSGCISRLFELYEGYMTTAKPTLVLIDTLHDDNLWQARPPSRSPSPSSLTHSGTADFHAPDEELYGLSLLQKLITEAHLRGVSKFVVPVPIIGATQVDSSSAPEQMTDGTVERLVSAAGRGNASLAALRPLMKRCLDLGAADVIISPLSSKCISSLEICAFRAHRDAARDQQALLEVKRGRKRSWVGVTEEKPFAYLRESMVSGLMNGICRLAGEDDQILSVHIAVSPERQADIAAAVGQWHFCAHSFSDDELVVAAMLMFKHALAMPELDKWRIPTEQLINFLAACRAAYNNFVPYHNFRHVVDVLQATFNFLLHIGAFPPYPIEGASKPSGERSPIAKLVTPFEALTLLITAIGHDVGHPGVNNGFLVTLNAPLAQLYNDRSVLESFHCAAYSQILRRYWPAAFADAGMRSLMISSILATDMGLHFDYMKKLGDLQDKLHENKGTDGWNGRQLEEQKALACSLLIKCADISNVARKHDTALKWMHILSEEFSRQASMESELKITSSLLAPPKKDLVSLAKAQISFMNLFAIPLFQGVSDIMPAMQYTVDELEANKSLFEMKIEVEKEKEKLSREDPTRKRLLKEGTFSPRTMSFAVASGDEQRTPQNTEGDSAATGPAGDVGMAPLTLIDEGTQDKSALYPPPTMEPAHVPSTDEDYKEVNGAVSRFDAVRDFADSDPFDSRRSKDAASNHKSMPSGGTQRCSETTEGSAAGTAGGDWASQAPSTSTSKMPISPSTQGTSIVSNDSTERYGGAGLRQFASNPSTHESSTKTKHDEGRGDEESNSTGSMGKAEGKSLKKRPSRFRMKDFPFFRRHHKESSPPLPNGETTG